MKLLIKQGHLLDPVNNRDGIFDLLIEEDKITKVEPFIEIADTIDKVIDAAGRFVMPGFIDLHVHLREPGFEYKETIKTGALAAARGGFTGICPMPNTKPAVDCAEVVDAILQKAKEEAVVSIYPIGAVTKGQDGTMLSDIAIMHQHGIIAISEDGKSVMETDLYEKAMKVASKENIPVFAHCEEKSLAGKGVVNKGAASEKFGFEGISNAVEDIIVARDIFLAKETKARLHLCHCSTKDSVALVKMAKEMGLPVTAEVCPHHFTMSDEEIIADDANYKMNPPLRTKQDIEALKMGLKENIMDVIATDHAPHSEEEKQKSIKDAPFGIVGLETAFALTVTELVKKGYLTPIQMVEKLSVNPANILGVDRGSLSVGKKADIVIADMDTEYEIEPAKFVSKGKNTPFAGKKVTGKILITIVNGNIIWEEKGETNK